MENVKNNYKSLLLDYSEASRIAQETGRLRLLSFALAELERFERSFIEHWSLEELLELQADFNTQGLMIL
ncbi:hypothetical protein [Bacillus sp. AFS040349]|uniref:hypothetical protein n=1 Tax=Bacillus sp. AFS040349 TaxID=2033502 RepID=UPI000BFC3468|nr:hypothetical protein [Bacillus sp. AFS040349]PGT81575.1 hypothetical protein COD11_17290 [Bacillus sp. AFS040349]